MQSHFGFIRFILYVFLFFILGSCAQRKSFNKRQFLPGRNTNLSQKLHFSKESKIKTEEITFIETEKSQTAIMDSIVTNDNGNAQKNSLNKPAQIAVAKFKTSAHQIKHTGHSFAQNKGRIKKLHPIPKIKKVQIESKSNNRGKTGVILLTTLLYVLGFAALGTALILIIVGVPEVLLYLIGGAGFILIFCAWTYWQKNGKTSDPNPIDPEVPDETPKAKKSSGNSITSETVLTVLLVISGIGLLAYYLFYY